MKTTLSFLTVLFFAATLVACSKNDVTGSLTKEELVAKVLSGDGNRVWHLKSIRVNNQEVSLTSSQQLYTKTYTLTFPQTTQGRFTDFDGYTGDWSMKGATAMQEIFAQIGGTGFGVRDYTISSITETALNMYYVQNNMKVEEVYYAH